MVGLKPSEEVVAASFSVASVLAIFSMHAPNLADVKADAANNDNTRRSIRSAVITSAAVVSGIALLAKSPAVYIVGGLVIVIEGVQYAHANTLSHVTAKPTTEVEAGGSLMGNVYGGAGNRWWVGLNTGSDQSTVFGTSSLLSPVGYESLPSGNARDDAQFAAAAAKNKGASAPVTISVEHVSWFNINGPYPTQKAANAAIPAIQKAHPAPGAISQAVDATTGQPQSSNSAAGLTTLLAELTAQGTWLRVAKVVVGSVMIIVGLLRLTGADGAVTTAAKGALL